MIAALAVLALALSACGEKRSTVKSAGMEWSRVPRDEKVFGGSGDQEMLSVTAGGPGLVAVGYDGSNAAVWLSEDGRSWARVPDDTAVFGGNGTQEMDSVIAGGPGLVAVGHEETKSGCEAVVWLSEDGRSWTRVPRERMFKGGVGEQKMFSVTAGGPGLVAVGGDASNGDYDAAVWLSKDGRSWTRVLDDTTVFGGAGGQVMTSVTAGGPGLVAVGDDDFQGPDDDAAVWLSKDGRSWTRVPHDEKVFGDGNKEFSSDNDQRMLSVTTGGPGLVAVGSDTSSEGSSAAVWFSRDGRSWRRVSRGKVVQGGEAEEMLSEMLSVTTGGPGLVAVGDDDYGAVVWFSKDGRSWARVPRDRTVFGDSGYQMDSVIAGGPGLIAVGSELDIPTVESDAAVWIASPGSG